VEHSGGNNQLSRGKQARQMICTRAFSGKETIDEIQRLVRLLQGEFYGDAGFLVTLMIDWRENATVTLVAVCFAESIEQVTVS